MKDWYLLSVDQALEELETSIAGISDKEVSSRRQQYGPNILEQGEQRGPFTIFLSQFKNVMILILAIAAIVSFVIGEYIDGIIVLVIIMANAIIGYIQEYNAEKSIRMLQKMAAYNALLIRNGDNITIETSELVPAILYSWKQEILYLPMQGLSKYFLLKPMRPHLQEKAIL